MKIIELKVIPNARKTSVEEEDGKYRVHIAAPAVDGKANKALIEALADYFNVKKRDIEIIKGETSRNKLIKISKSN